MPSHLVSVARRQHSSERSDAGRATCVQASANGSFPGDGTITGVRFPAGTAGLLPLQSHYQPGSGLNARAAAPPQRSPREGHAPSRAQIPPFAHTGPGPPPLKWNHSSTQKVLFAFDLPPTRYHGLSRGPPRSGCPATQLHLRRSHTAPAQAAGVTPMAEPIEVRQPFAKCAGPGCACDTDLDAGQATANPLS